MNMTHFEFIQTVEALLSIALILWLYKGPWQSLLIDITRQRLFESRDELFMYAAKGHISFNSDIYIEVRNYLNTSIRICHRLGLRSLLAVYFSEPSGETNKLSSRKSACILESVNKIEDINTRREVRRIILASTKYIITMMMARSLLALILYACYNAYARMRGRYRTMMSKIEHMIEYDISMGDA